ncbi:MAG TPA: thermonuclease family protein [Nocardioidaceae bacterium]|nr:thermonuclease family protein [Nocardioidaceae bacterium]
MERDLRRASVRLVPVGAALLAALAVAAVLRAGWMLGVPGPDPRSPTGPAGVATGHVPAERAAEVPAEAQRVVVLAHTDGDTLRVRLAGDGPAGPRGSQVVVRLLEVDTPELGRDGSAAECHARAAARALARMLPVGSVAWAEADRDLVDRYGRTLLYLHVRHGSQAVLVNRRLVGQGHGRAALFAPNDRHIEQLRAAERRARGAGRGLWGRCPERSSW